MHTDTPGADTLGSNSYPFAHKRVDTDPLGHVTTYRFDSLSRTTSITNAEGNTKVMAYDGVSKVSETDFKGETTSYGYDPLDRLTSVTDRLKQVTTISYDDTNGLTRTTTDRRGNQKVEVFDALGRLSSVSLGGQPLASYQYDGNGNRTAVIDGLGNQTNYVFDAFNRVASGVHGVTGQNPNGLQVETFGYDSNGNMTSYSDGVNTVSRVFDELNRLTSSTDGAGNATEFQYDGRNLMTARIEPNRDSGGNPTSVTHYQYNELGSLTQVTDAAGSIWQYGYDAEQKLTSITDALKNPATTFGYDSMHRLTSVNRPLGMTTTYQYDSNSNRTLMVDPLGHKFTSTYDALDRASTMSVVNSDNSSPQGRNGYTFGYDPEGNLTSAAESVTSGSTTATRSYSRTYDARNRLATAVDANGHSLAYSYDAANNLTGFTDAASRQSSYHYDGMNRLSSMTTGSGRAVSYAWQPNSLLSSVTYGNGMSRAYGYDNANRVTSIVNALGAADTEEFDYSYDANSNRTGETRKFDGATTRSLTYGYDAVNRLTQANYGGSSVMNYGYDAVGNRLTEQGTDPSGASVNKAYGYDALNRLQTMTDSVHSANSLTFAFDLNGNLTSQTDGSGNQRQYSYDAFNQALTASEVSGGTTTQLGAYDYDFQGRRISRTSGGSTLQYVYSGLNVVNEFGSSGQVVNSYDYGTDLVIAQIGGEGERLYFHDALGSTTALSSGTGSTVARYEYDAWGKQISTPQPSLNRVSYTGYRHDDETGLEYAMARYYDGTLGRFDSFDPVTESSARLRGPQGMDFYLYVGGNPLTRTDRSGQQWWRTRKRPHEMKWLPGGVEAGSDWEMVPPGQYKLTVEYQGYSAGTPWVAEENGTGTFPGGKVFNFAPPVTSQPRDAQGTEALRTEGTLSQEMELNLTAKYASRSARRTFFQNDPIDQFLAEHDHDPVMNRIMDVAELETMEGFNFAPSGSIFADEELSEFYEESLESGYFGLDQGRFPSQFWLFDTNEGENGFDFGAPETNEGDNGFDFEGLGGRRPVRGPFQLWTGPQRQLPGAGLESQKLLPPGNEAAFERGERLLGEGTSGANGGGAGEPPLQLGPGAPSGNAPLARYWPPNRGFFGPPERRFLMPGEVIDRYGSNAGSFVSPMDTPFEARSLPSQYLGSKPYIRFEVLKPIEVDRGFVAPAFGQKGFGLQYELPVSVDVLLRRGFLRIIK